MPGSNRYFEEELNYLIEAGREYAKLHPERARYLNLDDPRARDPHVERLIESFAFLSGQVRQKIEDEFPELTHALLNLVWPHTLRPVPPMAMLEFRPLPGMVRERQVIPKGFLVDSKLTSQEVPCRFRTAYPVEIYPFALADAEVRVDEAGQRKLRLRFELEEGADPAKFTVKRLRFYLAGEPAVAYNTYRVLRQTAEAVELRFSRSRKRLLPPEIIRPVGLGEDEEILPYPGISFPGYRLLSEYFAFPEKFLFLDFVDLGPLDLEPGERSFEIEVRFRKRPPDSFRPTRENFRLYATPIVNLFSREGEPIAVTHLKTATAVLADYTHPQAYEVISVDEVAGLRKGDRSSRSHVSFFSFEHGVGRGAADGGVYYHVTHHLSPAGRWETRLSLIEPERGQLPREETLSLRLTCMNGRLCREVGIDDVRVAGGERPDFVTFRNITRPTEPIYPQLGEGAEWRFISHMALNHLSLGDAAALRSVLALYDVGNRPANRRRIEALKASRVRPREIFLRGAPVRGTELTLEVDETHFDDEGDLLIFSEVLSEFFSLYASINSFTELIIHRHPSDEVLRCPAIAGKQHLI